MFTFFQLSCKVHSGGGFDLVIRIACIKIIDTKSNSMSQNSTLAICIINLIEMSQNSMLAICIINLIEMSQNSTPLFALYKFNRNVSKLYASQNSTQQALYIVGYGLMIFIYIVYIYIYVKN